MALVNQLKSLHLLIHSQYTPLVLFVLPYSGKFSQDKIFANYRLFAKILFANVLFFVDKDRAIALIREMLYLAHSRKFPAIWYCPLCLTMDFLHITYIQQCNYLVLPQAHFIVYLTVPQTVQQVLTMIRQLEQAVCRR